MYRIEHKAKGYWVVKYRYRGPFLSVVKYWGPFVSKLQADDLLTQKVELIYQDKLEGYQNVKNRNSQR